MTEVSIRPPVVDIGILTIRDDEFKAVLKSFPEDAEVYKGRHREYSLRTADAGRSGKYRLAVIRQIEQGNGEAQEAARDLIDDLQPSLLLVVGIAGGLPSDDFTLGDVILSTRIVDFSVEARKFKEDPTYNVGGGPIAKAIATGIANLSAREQELGDWWDVLPPKPKVIVRGKNQYYGPQKWQALVKEKLKIHYGPDADSRHPLFKTGPIASSDRLIKDPKLLVPWIATFRDLHAVEMESAGIHRATRDRTPMLAIRGVSDIVGLKRQEPWTKYACASAAAFARVYLRTGPVTLREPQVSDVHGARDEENETAALRSDDTQQNSEEAFANLIPLRHFPETLFVAPARCETPKQCWFLLRKGLPKGASTYVPGAWTLYEKNLYSFVDPEESRLQKIIDIGGLDAFSTADWAFSSDQSKRRVFVSLLNAALKEDLWSHGVRFHGDQEVYAFMGHPDEAPRRLKYPNLRVRSTSTVVSHYSSTSSTGKSYKFLRHTAFEGRFRLLGGQWYLEITPTYRFTRDGKQVDRYHERRLSKIKRIERNRSVLSQLLQWQAVLRAPWTKSDRSRMLEFGPLVAFEFVSPVDDSELTAIDAPAVVVSTDEELEQ